MLPSFAAWDFLAQFQRLLPRGRIWQRGWGARQAQALLILMPTWVRLHGRANALVADAFPCSTFELLPEWESSLGLPDECIGQLDTIQQRQAAVCAKFTARGGQSEQYFIDLAASAGFEVESIVEFAPFRASIDRCGQPLNSEAWAYAWQVIAPPTTIVYFRAGASTAGEPLAAWGNTTLICLIERYAPAHTVPIFRFTAESIWDHGTSFWDDGESEPWDPLPSVTA
jgi:uncharacterized protein YmfQ (DUF2313 family)